MLARPLALASLLVIAVPSQAPTITSPVVQRTRAVWFVEGENPIGAEVGFAYEAVAWDNAAAATFGEAKPGTRVALGAESWAALETFGDLKAGTATVKAGNYYAVLEKSKDGWMLGLLDPNKVRAAQLPPGVGKGVPLLAALPLTAADGPDGPLRVAWASGPQNDSVVLVLQFGPHTLRATTSAKGAGTGKPALLPDRRGTSRATFGPGDGARESFAIVDHGVVPWNDEHANEAKSMAIGKHWRLGKDWATTLDTNVPLGLGGRRLAAGSWHLTLGKGRDGWSLVVSPAEADHRGKVDGFAADLVKSVLEVPLQRSAATPASDALQLAFAADGSKTELVITFGPERLTVPIAAGKN